MEKEMAGNSSRQINVYGHKYLVISRDGIYSDLTKRRKMTPENYSDNENCENYNKITMTMRTRQYTLCDIKKL